MFIAVDDPVLPAVLEKIRGADGIVDVRVVQLPGL